MFMVVIITTTIIIAIVSMTLKKRRIDAYRLLNAEKYWKKLSFI